MRQMKGNPKRIGTCHETTHEWSIACHAPPRCDKESREDQSREIGRYIELISAAQDIGVYFWWEGSIAKASIDHIRPDSIKFMEEIKEKAHRGAVSMSLDAHEFHELELLAEVLLKKQKRDNDEIKNCESTL
jgi:hypothetical protein